MYDYTKKLAEIGVKLPTILIPKKDVDPTKWAVVACDQYTSEPEYWQSVEQLVGEEPSTFNLIYPECYLEESDPDARIEKINSAMRTYISEGVFDSYPETCFLIYRQTAENRGRWGLVLALDLEKYDYSKDSTSLIRATEGTIIERIPPRKRIRKDAPLEFPHIIVLIDDASRSIIEPLAAKKEQLKKVYSFDLMKSSGSITAYAVDQEEDLQKLADAFTSLADPSKFAQRYGKEDLLLFAMGDGNHSLATAKSCWEDIKKDLSAQEQADHPARFALVEIENIFDEGLEFEPIHRVLFGGKVDAVLAHLSRHCSSYEVFDISSLEEMNKMIATRDEYQYFGLTSADGKIKVVRIEGADSLIVAGTMQATLDEYLAEGQSVTIDYTHGTNVTYSLGSKPGNVGIFLPGIAKNEFFASIVTDGALPRKTFSMGEDFEKRFYIEGRKITR